MNNFFAFRGQPATTWAMRSASLICLAVCSVLGACSDLRGIGERCFDTRECDFGVCVETVALGRVCLHTCEAGDLFCEGSEVCVESESEAELFVCSPGGDAEEGESCTTSLACAVGNVCVDTANTCQPLCNPMSGSPCSASEVCEAFMGSTERGSCIPAPP